MHDTLRYDPFSYELHENPYPVYARLRAEAPAYHNEERGFWALSRYDDVRTALLDHETYCSSRGFTLEDIGDFALPMLLGMDPPDHTRLRATIHRALTPKRIAMLESPVRALARELLGRVAPRGHCDMIADFAAILPMAVIARMLGVPERDHDRLRRLADEMLHREHDVAGVPESGKRAAGEIYAYFDALLGERGTRDADDLLSLLLEAEGRGEISHVEILGFCFLLIIAGNETTTKLIGNMTFQLSAHPAQREHVVADRSLVANAVEEVLRYDTSTHMMARTLTRDVELHGRRMHTGTKVALILASANRDERRWPSPECFDIRRDTSEHLAFGFGVHHCVGAALARLEARVALDELLSMLPDFTVDADGLERAHSGNVRGYTRVPVRFTPTTLDGKPR
jgi:cytochrome P450